MYSFIRCIAFFLQFNLVFMSICDKSTCDECITDPNICAWCAMKSYNETIRCKPANSLPDGWCPELIQNPLSNLIIPETGDKDFSDSEGNVVQIKPQIYKMNLRPGDSVNFNFSYFASKDYPVDLYFLIDTSSTMENIISDTTQQSEKIYGVLKNKTKNVYLGLGTFVDKNVLPFVHKINSTRTYSFKHQLHLMDNYTEFKETLINTPFGENRDQQEGGFDALAQVMACESIGWRNASTKIIVFLTNSPYHVAGDGKGAGLFEPYDGKCYVENGVYTKETVMDYPSLGMINKLATENNMIIFFLVHSDVGNIYEHVQGTIRGSKFEKFSPKKDSDRLVTIIKKIYEDITNNIRIQVDQKSVQNVQFDFSPDCYKNIGNTELCKTKLGVKQDFTGTISLSKYSGVNNIKIDIRIEGISEKLSLDIDVINKCDCDNDTLLHSDDCHGDTLQCGQCICSDNRYGNKCACEKNADNSFRDDSACIAENSGDICSKHGSCHCGACECDNGYTGTFCQCFDAKCNGCSGNGDCECGHCKCKHGYTGDFCQCHNNHCKSHQDKAVCNHRGVCNCNSCKCNKMKEWDKRSENKFCELSPLPEVHNLQCKTMEPCVLCKLENKTYCADCDSDMRIELVERLSEEMLADTSWMRCEGLSVDVGCKSRFLYRYDVTIYGITIKAQREKECAQDYLLYGGVIVATLILVGVGTLIAWKVVTYNRDKREFDDFVDRNKKDISELDSTFPNPCYAPPTVTFKNPGFKERSAR